MGSSNSLRVCLLVLFKIIVFGLLLFSKTYRDLSFAGGSVIKNPPANAGDTRNTGSILGVGRSPAEGHGNSLQYFCRRIPWTEEPGKLQSMRSQRVRHD